MSAFFSCCGLDMWLVAPARHPPRGCRARCGLRERRRLPPVGVLTSPWARLLQCVLLTRGWYSTCMDDYELGWAVGFFEGEGCIYVQRHPKGRNILVSLQL